MHVLTLPSILSKRKGGTIGVVALVLWGFNTASAQFLLNFSLTQPTCFGLSTGAITVTPIGGIGPYSYVWSNGATTSTISNIPAGTYSVTVTGSNGVVAGTVTLDQPTQVLANIVGDTCNFPAVITATGWGGTGPYTYAWDTGDFGQTIVINAPGMYCVTVVDATWCGIVECLKVSATPVNVSIQATNLTCPGVNTGQMQAFATGGTAPYIYAWSNGFFGQTISNLAAGTYTVTVTDARGCTRTATGIVASPPPLVPTINATNPTCLGLTNGSAIASATGGTPPYLFTWSNGATGQVISNLGPGSYSVTVRDANNCLATQTVTLVAQSNLTINAIGTPPACPGVNTGSATATPSGGVQPYTYLWSIGGTTQTINNLAPGTYAVTVTDALGCSAFTSVVVPAAPAFNLNITSTNVTTCGANNGTATVTVLQGLPPYTYQWSNGVSGTPTITNLPPGTYTVTVTTGNNCQATRTVVITQPPPVFVNVMATPLVCTGQSTGTASAIVTGGTPPFNFIWNNAATTQTITGLAPGQYSVTVTDAVGCQASAGATIQAAPLPVVGINADAVVCGAGNTGTATAFANNGLPPYNFQWSTGATGPFVGGLTTGTYSVTATDANQCAGTASVNITVVDNLVVTVTRQSPLCFGGNTGSAMAMANGGSAPYTFLWSTGAQGPNISGLTAGIYTVTVTDANGCTASGTAIIGQPPLLTVTINANELQLCPGEATATLTAQPNGGTPGYTYLWSTGATTQIISNLSAGTYSVTVTDMNGCTATASITITQFQAMQVQINGAEVVCGEANTGSASVIVTGGTGPFTYLWNTGSVSESLGGLGTGTYSVTVTDINGCTSSADINILVVSEFQVTVTPRDVLCFGGNSGSALATASGGALPYTYTWSNGTSGPEVLNLTAGEYFVTVTENNGCVIIVPVQINQPPLLQLAATTTNVSCFGGSNGTATALASGGVPPYQYSWSNGQTGPVASGLPAGNYTVTVQDINFCTATRPVQITQPTALSVNVSAVNPLCPGVATGSATATATGGTGPYTFLWSNGSSTATIVNLMPGAYAVTVVDQNGCVATGSVVITAPPAIQIVLNTTNIICSNQNIGAINASASGGTPPYTYQWNTGQTGPVITNLAPGAYVLTVTDSNGCRQITTGNITQTMQLAITANVTPVTCFGLSNGSISLSVTGGLPPYTYVWSNGANTPILSGLAPGNYSVTVTGQDGCTGNTSVMVTQPSLFTATASATAVTCHGQANGSASVSVSGGVAPFTYQWSNGMTTPVISNLSPGSYSVTVFDANNCDAISGVIVTQPTLLTVSVAQIQGTCTGFANGALSASASGGTGAVTFQWSNGGTGSVLSNVQGGTYSVTATDANGCTAVASFSLPAFANPACSIGIVNYVVRGSDGALTTSVTGGTPPYTYAWNNGATSSGLSGLTPGTYSVTVTDANGCTSTCIMTLPIPAGVGDYVWLDIDYDGIQDPGEPGIPGVTVILSGTQENTPYADTTVTNTNGFYFFPVPPGEYKVTFILPAGTDLTPSTPNAGNNDARDSDIDPVSLMTPFFVIPPGVVDLSWDAGFTPPCINITNPGTIGPGYQFLCGPGNIPATLTSITLPSGGTVDAPIEYIWMRSVVNGPFNSGHWELIPGTNSPSYNPGPVYQTTYFARCARRVECGPFLESNIVVVEVGNISVANISGPSIVCLGQPATFFATGTAPGAVIQWTFGPGVSPQSATGSPVTVNFTSFGTFQVNLSVTQNGCTATNSRQITVTNSPIFCGNGLVIHGEATPLRESLIEWELPEQEPPHLYVLERSFDGIAFETLAEITQHDRISGGLKHFRFLDEEPKNGRNYYRVKYISHFNGEAGYSNVAEVIIYTDSKLALLYPNPVTGQATLELFETFNGDVTLDVVAANGMRLQRMILPRDVKRQSIDFSAYPAGVYFLRLRYGDVELKRLKVVKM